jgi:hypothetical protein
MNLLFQKGEVEIINKYNYNIIYVHNIGFLSRYYLFDIPILVFF